MTLSGLMLLVFPLPQTVGVVLGVLFWAFYFVSGIACLNGLWRARSDAIPGSRALFALCTIFVSLTSLMLAVTRYIVVAFPLLPSTVIFLFLFFRPDAFSKSVAMRVYLMACVAAGAIFNVVVLGWTLTSK